MPPSITTSSAAWHLTSFVSDSGQEFTEEQWYDFCSARLNLIRPHLSEHTLSTLSKVECVQVATHKSELHRIERRFATELVDNGADYSDLIQGIFGVGATELETKWPYSDGITWIYGVERRSGCWVLAKVWFRGGEGWKARGQQYPQHFELTEVGIEDMCETARVHPKQVFELLGQQVGLWFGAATRRYNEMTNLAHLVSAEDLILKARMTELDEEGAEEEDSGDDFDPDDPTKVEGYDIDHEGTAEL